MRNAKLAKEILRMTKLDQKVRKAYIKNLTVYNGKKLQAIDIENLKKMKRIVKEFGWPTTPLVGKKASHSAWLLVQHADSDIKFQEYCLRLMKKAVREDDVSKVNIAYLTDRILVNKGSPQVYGTQFYRDASGKWVPRPIADIKSLDQRRKTVGLNRFEVYRKKLGGEKAWLL